MKKHHQEFSLHQMKINTFKNILILFSCKRN